MSLGLDEWYEAHDMRPTYVKDAQNLKALAEVLRGDGLVVIYHDDVSFSAYRGQQVVKFVRVRNSAD